MFESIRNKKLIEEQLAYEENFFSAFLLDIRKNEEIEELISHQIENYEEDFYQEPDCSFEDFFEYDYEYDFYNGPVDSMESAYSCCGFQNYISNDGPFDNLDGCDYPEGPNENLCGFRYPNEFNDIEYDFCDIEPIYEIDSDERFEQSIENAYEEQVELEELCLNRLIDQYLEEERQYLESVMEFMAEMEQDFVSVI